MSVVPPIPETPQAMVSVMPYRWLSRMAALMCCPGPARVKPVGTVSLRTRPPSQKELFHHLGQLVQRGHAQQRRVGPLGCDRFPPPAHRGEGGRAVLQGIAGDGEALVEGVAAIDVIVGDGFLGAVEVGVVAHPEGVVVVESDHREVPGEDERDGGHLAGLERGDHADGAGGVR
jgi:hypothetical protein